MSARLKQPPGAHPGDGILLALHDGEPGSEVGAIRGHVERCAECRARLTAIAESSDRVGAALASIDVPRVSQDEFRRRLTQPRRRGAVPVWRRPGWRVAAAFIVLAGAAAASPIRRWFGERGDTPRTAPDSIPRPIALPVQSAESVGASVSFAATDTAFTVRFDSLPEAGTLTARRSSDANITARIVSGAGTGGDALVVLPGELRVRNAASSRASYGITLPDTVTRLRVIVGRRSIFDGTPPVELQLNPPR